MTDKKSNDSRRKLLKSIAAGSGAVVAGKSLPESWSKPVIDSVVLPVHAETTDDSGSGSGDAQCCLTTGLYCGTSISINNGGITPFVSIDVAADGTLIINAWKGAHTKHSGSTSIPCTGKKFSVDLTKVQANSGSNTILEQPTTIPAPTVTVSGEVICGQTIIEGKIIWNGEYSYEAMPDCEE
ncbi:MAG: hypothetical protein GY727_00440 [Gammaproteobacteria bacterium]|nr:hypothetical protein [Gammaproteobacteria bacterium]